MRTSSTGVFAAAILAALFLAVSACDRGAPAPVAIEGAPPPGDTSEAPSASASRAADAPQDAASRPAPSTGPLIVLSGHEKGFIRPCGCSKPKLGGIDKRAHALAELRRTRPDLVAVSVGDMIDEGGRQQELKLEHFLMALSEMRYDALVPGAGEFKIGAQAFAERRGLASFPVVLANARIGEEEVFTPQAPLGATGGVLIGLVAPLPPQTGVTTTPAAEALAREIASCAEAAFVLVVYNGPEEDLSTLAEAVPEAHRAKTLFAVPGYADAPVRLAKDALGMPVVAAGAKGRALGLIRPGAAQLVDALVLEEKRPADPKAAEILASYRRAVADEGLLTRVNRVPAPGAYAGDAACASCHRAACDELSMSRHQRAWETLKKSGDDQDPECAKCHVTGWGLEGGFVDPASTPERTDVDCEHCHGPSLEHVQNRTKTPGGKVDVHTCRNCHDPDNSPLFTFEAYWPKIQHR
ncbi:MAG TPA: multiheme c-type cytochrome [Planctomycetota bacterium]|nr:multiheme c-type cytochrome [Planctomycetota bacterium]